MKKTSILIISVFIMAILTACGSSADNSQKQETIVKQPEATSMTVETGADIFEIIPTQVYTEEDLNYNDDNCRANKEQNDDTARPEISNDLSATTKYDIVYLGHPIWWGTVPRIIQTYLETYDLSNATIYTFCTSGGSSIDRSLSDLRAWYPTLNIVDGKRLNDASKSEIAGFCNR